MQQGLLIVVSGPAGSGKGTTVSKLIARPEFDYSVSATTRSPRVGEQHGREYYFYDKATFETMIRGDKMLEYAEYCGNYYGTPKAAVEEKLAKGIHVILEIDVQGALQIKEKFPQALLIMITPPDFATLESRLRGRGTNTEEDIRNRLAQSRKELQNLSAYDYLVVSQTGGQDTAVREILEIVAAEGRRISRLAGGADGFAKRFYETKN